MCLKHLHMIRDKHHRPFCSYVRSAGSEKCLSPSMCLTGKTDSVVSECCDFSQPCPCLFTQLRRRQSVIHHPQCDMMRAVSCRQGLLVWKGNTVSDESKKKKKSNNFNLLSFHRAPSTGNNFYLSLQFT